MQLNQRNRIVFPALIAGSLLIVFGAQPIPPAMSEAEPLIPGLPGPAEEWPSAPISGGLKEVPVRNFGVVSPGCLYRSGQPTVREYEWLAEQGIRGIVCLRAERSRHHEELDRLREQGLEHLHLPIVNQRAPTDEQARAFLEFVRNSENWPILVHCEGGMGRAGTMAALARYAIDGWSMSKALHEARKYRPFGMRMFGEQRRWLNRWKDRFPPGEYHPSKPLPGRLPSATAKESRK